MVSLTTVSFLTSVSGARLRGRFTLNRLEEIEGGVQTTWGVIVECEGTVDETVLERLDYKIKRMAEA